MKYKVMILKELLADFNKHNALSPDLTNSEVEAIKSAIEALEKQIPKLVEIIKWNPCKCPTCGEILSESIGDGYYSHPTFLERCPNVECSQRLIWD